MIFIFNYKIAIIDDEDFYYREQLSRLGFNITKYDDIEDLNMLASYDLIISDIKGVDKHFDSEFEGARGGGQINDYKTCSWSNNFDCFYVCI